MANPDTLYSPQDSQTKKKIDQLTDGGKSWDYYFFQQVLVVTSVADCYLPNKNRPDSIHIQGMRQHIDKLKELASTLGVEVARSAFVDLETKKIVYGKTTKGQTHSVRVDWSPEPGREKFQRPAFSLHIHPDSPGFTGADFIHLLQDPRQKGMIMALGKNEFILLKTAGTPSQMQPERIKKRITELEAEFKLGSLAGTHFWQRLKEFNKTVCVEFGLVMYIAPEQSRDLAIRVDVTK